MGKTAAGAVWLNADQVSPYEYWQYWRNTEDADVVRFLKLFTVMPLDEIARLAALAGRRDQRGKERSSPPKRPRWSTAAAAADEAAATARTTFEEGGLGASLPTVEMPRAELKAGIGVLAAFVKAGLAASNGEVRRAIANNAISVNDVRVTSDKAMIGEADVTADGVDQAFARPQASRPAQAGLTQLVSDCRCGRRCRRSASPSSAPAAMTARRRKFEHLAQQSRRQRRQRIDVQHRLAGLADHLIGDADEAFFLAAEEQPDDREAGRADYWRRRAGSACRADARRRCA